MSAGRRRAGSAASSGAAAARVEPVAEDRRTAACRRTRPRSGWRGLGPSSSARFLVMAGPAAVRRADMKASPKVPTRRPPVPPMKSSVPPGRTLPTALRGDLDRQQEDGASTSRRALFEVELAPAARSRRTRAGNQHMVDRGRAARRREATAAAQSRWTSKAAVRVSSQRPARCRRSASRAVRITLRSLTARKPGRLEPDTRAAADHDDGLSKKHRADPGDSGHRPGRRAHGRPCATRAPFRPDRYRHAMRAR